MEVGNGRDSTQDVVWGPLVFEARRFVELRKKSLWQQFLSAESFGMGLFYTLNVSLLPTLHFVSVSLPSVGSLFVLAQVFVPKCVPSSPCIEAAGTAL